MGREKNTRERVYTFESGSTREITVGPSPVSIVPNFGTEATLEEVEVYFGVDVYATWSTSTDSVSRLSSPSSRRKYLKGTFKSFFRRSDELQLFVKSVDGSTYTEAIDVEKYYSRRC